MDNEKNSSSPVKFKEAFVNFIKNNDYMNSLPTLFKWLLLSSGIGVIVGCIGSLFAYALSFANTFRSDNPKMLLLLPIAGLLIVFCYKICKDDDDKGTNTIVASIQDSSDIPFKMAPLIFISTVLTQIVGGSAGREGAAVQLGGSISKWLSKVLKLNENI